MTSIPTSKRTTRSKTATPPSLDGVTPTLSRINESSSFSSVTVEDDTDIPSDSESDSEEEKKTPPPPPLSEEEQLIALVKANDEELLLMRITRLQQKVKQQDAERQSLLIQQQSASLSSAPPTTAVPSTPVTAPSSVNRSLFERSSFYTPSAATIAKKAQTDRLPSVGSESIPPLPPSHPPSSGSSDHPAHIRHTPPVKFTGEKDSQNADVEQWIEEANIYFDLSGIEQSRWLSHAQGLMSGQALKWLGEKREELSLLNKVMDWAWLQQQLIEDFGRASGVVALQHEWAALRMGIVNTDGTKVGGKSTFTVKAYTFLFTRLMRTLTTHNLHTTDILVIERYLAGIKLGYPTLYNEMRGMHTVLLYLTLAEAISGAQIAESALAVGKMQTTSSSSSHSNNWRGNRSSATQLNNFTVEGDALSTDAQYDTSSTSSGKEGVPSQSHHKQLNGFIYRPSPDDGRHKLTEKECRMLYDARHCYTCYEKHQLGKGCKKIKTFPPPSLPAALKNSN
jgi:hypothetical protein